MEVINLSNLLKDNNELMNEYNYEKNTGFILDKIKLGSSKKIWWKCSSCNNEWEATPKNRFRGGTGCPVCGLKKIGINRKKAIIEKNGSLFDNRPDLSKEWNYKKNYPLTPKDVSVGSKQKVWWICQNGHEWESAIYSRTAGHGCIYCTRQKTIIGENDLPTTNPELLKEWDYKKNIDIKPENVMSGSNQKVWWICPLGHSWKTTVAKRSGGTGCPHCYSEYGTSFPEQAILYYLSKVTEVESRRKVENQEIDIYLPLLNIGFEYDGSYYHENEKSKYKEKRKNLIIEQNDIDLYHIKESDKNYYDKSNKIIYCVVDRKYKYLEVVLENIQKIINKRIEDIDIERDQVDIYNLYVKKIKDNNFTILHPELLKEWDYNRNGELLPESLSAGSNKRVWWICSKCGSSFFTSVGRRIEYSKCPYCSAKKVNETNCLETRFPILVKYWDYNLNESLLPSSVYYSSRISVWWKCEKCGKSYKMSICSRIKSKTNYCFDCKHEHIGDMNRVNSISENNSLYINRPDLVKEWNYDKNYPLTPKDVTTMSGKKVWWVCAKCKSEWQSTIYNRSLGTGCPECYKNNLRKY